MEQVVGQWEAMVENLDCASQHSVDAMAYTLKLKVVIKWRGSWKWSHIFLGYYLLAFDVSEHYYIASFDYKADPLVVKGATGGMLYSKDIWLPILVSVGHYNAED